jgi:hypothetical protein
MIISVATDSGLIGDAAMLETSCAADCEEAAAQVEEKGGVPAGVGEAPAAAAEAEEGDAELAAAAATAAAAVHIADAGSECERLAGLGHELAAAQRALLIAEGKGPGTDLTAFKLRWALGVLRVSCQCWLCGLHANASAGASNSAVPATQEDSSTWLP